MPPPPPKQPPTPIFRPLSPPFFPPQTQTILCFAFASSELPLCVQTPLLSPLYPLRRRRNVCSRIPPSFSRQRVLAGIPSSPPAHPFSTPHLFRSPSLLGILSYFLFSKAVRISTSCHRCSPRLFQGRKQGPPPPLLFYTFLFPFFTPSFSSSPPGHCHLFLLPFSDYYRSFLFNDRRTTDRFSFALCDFFDQETSPSQGFSPSKDRSPTPNHSLESKTFFRFLGFLFCSPAKEKMIRRFWLCVPPHLSPLLDPTLSPSS